jgi:putative transposase
VARTARSGAIDLTADPQCCGSTEWCADLLRDCRRRGTTAPMLAVGDGAPGFWKAVREVFPATREQRC